MDTNLKKYKPLDSNWISENISKLGLKEYCEFEARVNGALDVLRPGRNYNIAEQVPEEQQNLFVKLCCSYIDQHPAYEMSDDYCRIHNRSDRL